MLLKGKCKKCGRYQQFDIGDMKREEVELTLKSISSFHCNAGSHVEMISPYELYDFDWDDLTVGETMTEEEFLEELKKQFKEVYSSDELDKHYTVQSFLYGSCLCNPIDGDEDEMVIFQFTNSPKGKRYYYLVA